MVKATTNDGLITTTNTSREKSVAYANSVLISQITVSSRSLSPSHRVGDAGVGRVGRHRSGATGQDHPGLSVPPNELLGSGLYPGASRCGGRQWPGLYGSTGSRVRI